MAEPETKAASDPPAGRRLDRVVAAIYDTPHVITGAKLEEVCALIDRRLASAATAEELLGFPEPAPRDEAPYQITAGGVAVLSLQGVIAKRLGLVVRASGGTSSEQFAQAVNRAASDPAVKAIVLDVNSPGGAFGGTPEAAAAVRDAARSKPVAAVANSQMDSGAYWIGSAAGEVVAAPSATLGSIGVYLIHEDATASEQRRGIKRTLVKAGKFKAIHESPLDAATQAKLQERVDGIHDLFVEAVAGFRNTSAARVRSGFGEGDSLLAREAVSAGLADRVATLDQVIADLEAGHAGRVIPTQPAAGLSPRRNLTTQASSTSQGALSMEPKVKASLVALGLCAPDASDETAQAVLSGYFAGRNQTLPTEPQAVVDAILGKTALPAAPPAPVTLPVASGPTADDVADRVHAKLKAEEEFRRETIRAQCDLVGLSAEDTQGMVNMGLAPAETTKKIKERLAVCGEPVPRLTAGPAEKDKWCGVVQQEIGRAHV
jgi:signal peptide peptidase SppA